jgi:hypothetical protein
MRHRVHRGARKTSNLPPKPVAKEDCTRSELLRADGGAGDARSCDRRFLIAPTATVMRLVPEDSVWSWSQMLVCLEGFILILISPTGCGDLEFVQRLYSRFAFLAFFALLAFSGINSLIVFNSLRGFDSRRLHQQV